MKEMSQGGFLVFAFGVFCFKDRKYYIPLLYINGNDSGKEFFSSSSSSFLHLATFHSATP
jgi:hypothetical protein